MALVSMERALRHLRILVGEAPEDIEDVEEFADVEFKLDQACDIVLDYLKDRDNVNDWDEETTPKTIQAAVLLVLSDLFEHRAGASGDAVFISAAVKSLLERYRDPALA